MKVKKRGTRRLVRMNAF